MAELEFVDELPTTPKGKGAWRVTEARAAELRANPGRWAKWPAKTQHSGVKKALARVGPGYEVRLINKVVYVRFVDAEPVTTSAAGTTTPCPACDEPVTVAGGETRRHALQRHGQEEPECAAIIARRR